MARSARFQGFVRFAELPGAVVPNVDGVYAVLRTATDVREFLETSPAGHFKGRDPSLSLADLRQRWVSGAAVVYLGKAAAGLGGRRGLGKRLSEYRRHGAGEPVGHWGGRAIWQLSDSADLLVGWKSTPAEDPEDVESELLRQFSEHFGTLPFANHRRGRLNS